MVATHYAEAQRATAEGPERDALAARAREWLTPRGRRALALGSAGAGPRLPRAGAGADRGPAAAGGAPRHWPATPPSEPTHSSARLAHYEAAIGRAPALPATSMPPGAARRVWPGSLGDGLSRVSGAPCARAEQGLTKLGRIGKRASPGRPGCDARLTAELSPAATAQALAWAETACTLAERIDDTELLGRAIGAKSAALFRTWTPPRGCDARPRTDGARRSSRVAASSRRSRPCTRPSSCSMTTRTRRSGSSSRRPNWPDGPAPAASRP